MHVECRMANQNLFKVTREIFFLFQIKFNISNYFLRNNNIMREKYKLNFYAYPNHSLQIYFIICDVTDMHDLFNF